MQAFWKQYAVIQSLTFNNNYFLQMIGLKTFQHIGRQQLLQLVAEVVLGILEQFLSNCHKPVKPGSLLINYVGLGSIIIIISQVFYSFNTYWSTFMSFYVLCILVGRSIRPSIWGAGGGLKHLCAVSSIRLQTTVFPYHSLKLPKADLDRVHSIIFVFCALSCAHISTRLWWFDHFQMHSC